MFTMAVMLTGRLLAESLRVCADLEVADLRVVRIGRHDVSTRQLALMAPTLLTTARGAQSLANHRSGRSSTSKLPTIEPTIWHRP